MHFKLNEANDRRACRVRTKAGPFSYHILFKYTRAVKPYSRPKIGIDKASLIES